MGSFGDINRVNTNVQALDAQYALNRVNRDLELSRNKQVTGKQINKSEDDAAGYSIATKLKSRVAGLEQSLQNIADAKSILNIVESSFDTIMDSLIEMKSLATQASNETMSHSDRALIGDQIEAIGLDINETANQTVYQDKELLNGTGYTGSLDLTFQTGERAEDTITASINAVNISNLFSNSGFWLEGWHFLDWSSDFDSLYSSYNGLGAPEHLGGAGFYGSAINISHGFYDSPGVFNIDDNATVADYNSFIGAIDSAIDTMVDNMNSICITQSSLSLREDALFKSITSNESAKSRIMDTDLAKEHSETIRLQILQKTATSALAQANNGPQSVLGFL